MRNRTQPGGVEPTDDEATSAADPGSEGHAESDLSVLMARYAGGDAEAFEKLFALLSPRVYGFHLRSTGSSAVAEDLTQRTFLKLHVARRRYRHGARLEPWLFAIAKNVQRDMLRRRRRSREHLTDDGRVPANPDPAEAPPEEDLLLRRRINAAIAALPNGQRDVVLLHKFEGLSMQEVADALNIGLSAAKVRAFRAYRTLRKSLGQEGS